MGASGERIADPFLCKGYQCVLCPRILPHEKRALEGRAAYLVRSSFSRQRLEYRPEEAKVTYCSKDRKEKKNYDAPEWLAAMGSHVPERGEFVVEGWWLEGKPAAAVFGIPRR